MMLQCKMLDDSAAGSPTSVLEDEENGQMIPDSSESSHISSSMVEEERKLLEARTQIEDKEENVGLAKLSDTQFSKLDELLNQTQLYSEFLLEKIEEDEKAGEESTTKRGRRGAKRKATSNYNSGRAKRAVAAMLTRDKDTETDDNENFTEEERLLKQQEDFVPLLTGGKLKSYQLKGVKWLVSLWKNGLNGILADQMGLGKTIQTIGLLAHLRGKGIIGPFLIIAPLSTLSNWVNEFARFAPSLKAMIYHGSKEARAELRKKHMPRTIGPNFPVIVTSYEVAMTDAKKFLRFYSWKYIIVDEGHRLKNSKCKLVKELRHLISENKLLLTGTPLQNNLAELWSLLHFILPDIFQSLQEFESWFDLSGKFNGDTSKEEAEENKKSQIVAKLHAILRPFLLRRMKSEVEKMLPRKKEIILYATMTENQKDFQKHLLNKSLKNHMIKTLHPGGRRTTCTLNNLMIQLRKNCYHPDILESAFDDSYFYPPAGQLVQQCGKFQLLERLLNKLLAMKHKVLIFSQWTKVLDIIDYYLGEKEFEVCRIDGKVKLDERRRQIDEFNDVNSNYRIFILSTRAGGLGINLTSADTCIIYDSDWNPQMDLQAMDRCHRIGQTKPVHVYRLVTAQSVECRMLKRAFGKLKLEHVVIAKGQFHQERTKSNASSFNEEDILALLKDDETEEEKWVQTDVSDLDLDRILDRSDLLDGSDVPPLPLKGPGWEVVLPTATAGGLSALGG